MKMILFGGWSTFWGRFLQIKRTSVSARDRVCPCKAPEEGRLCGPPRCRRRPAGASDYRSDQTQSRGYKRKKTPFQASLSFTRDRV